jgi:hypothetical protein
MFLAAVGRLAAPRTVPGFLPAESLSRDGRLVLLEAFLQHTGLTGDLRLSASLDGNRDTLRRLASDFLGLPPPQCRPSAA